MGVGQSVHLPIDVLIVDADPAQRRALAGLITDRAVGRFAPRGCETAGEAIAAARAGSIVIADVETVGGASRLAEMMTPSMPLIATSARGSVNAAVAAVKAGAIDFLAKPIGASQLIERLEAAVSGWRANAPEPPATGEALPARHSAQPMPGSGGDFAGFIGGSPAMRQVYEQVRRIAPSHAPVFVTGESGTGKELCAEAVHAHAGPNGRPFVAINCSAIPKDLMESEIFGHVRGAFTGATENRVGAAELADGGTLFLDEIAEMDFALQAKLLRFLQSGSVRRVGGSEQRPVTVRVICATNRDPQGEVAAGRFRADLFYRLHVLPIHLPALRQRREDIMALASAFLARFSAEENRAFTGFEPEAADELQQSPWPGNVRQLQNVVRRIVVLHDAPLVTRAMLPEGLRAGPSEDSGAAPPMIAPFWRQEQRIIEATVAACGGNIARAAAALEISPSTIYRKRDAWAKHQAA
jgi:two-component system repressor protein LuxO